MHGMLIHDASAKLNYRGLVKRGKGEKAKRRKGKRKKVIQADFE
jgi:hypothetical protein